MTILMNPICYHYHYISTHINSNSWGFNVDESSCLPLPCLPQKKLASNELLWPLFRAHVPCMNVISGVKIKDASAKLFDDLVD